MGTSTPEGYESTPFGSGRLTGDPGADPDPYPVPAPQAARRRREVGAGLGVLAVAALLGGPIGLLWAAVAPRVQVQMTPDGPALVSPEPEQFIADEGWYIFLTVGYAVLLTLLVWALLRRYRGPVMLVALAAGTALAGVFAWWAGSHLGLAHYHDLLRQAPVGTRFAKPVGLRAQKVGLLYGWLPSVRGDVLLAAVASTATYLLLAGFASRPDLQPETAGGPAGTHGTPDRYGDPAGTPDGTPDRYSRPGAGLTGMPDRDGGHGEPAGGPAGDQER